MDHNLIDLEAVDDQPAAGASVPLSRYDYEFQMWGLEDELENAKVDGAQKVKELKAKHREAVEDLKTKHKETIKSITTTHEQLLSEKKSKLKYAKDEREEIMRQIKELEKIVADDELIKVLEKSEHLLLDKRGELQLLTTRFNSMRETVSKLEKEFQQSESAKSSIQASLASVNEDYTQRVEELNKRFKDSKKDLSAILDGSSSQSADVDNKNVEFVIQTLEELRLEVNKILQDLGEAFTLATSLTDMLEQ